MRRGTWTSIRLTACCRMSTLGNLLRMEGGKLARNSRCNDERQGADNSDQRGRPWRDEVTGRIPKKRIPATLQKSLLGTYDVWTNSEQKVEREERAKENPRMIRFEVRVS
ncbi:hypothetical protein Mapa_008360 [Marchantia paleacea]|nr:hypothetical protein Mapa_008360 [Marchantia paleacea]